jgi:hypothetical protein
MEARRFAPHLDAQTGGAKFPSSSASYTRGPVSVRKPSAGALFLALIPFVAMCLSVPLWDRIYPMILGIPFNLFWLIAWIVLSTFCMWGAYRVEVARDKKDIGAQ